MPKSFVPTAAPAPGGAGRGAPAPDRDAVLDAIRRGVAHLEAIQTDRGCVEGEVVWCPVLTAQYVITAYLTGQTIPPDRRDRFLRHFEVWQTADGGWGLHAESPAYVYVTTLTYIALRLLGVAPDAPPCRRGRAWLASHGGVLQVPSWGKAWLAMMNLYDWGGVPAVLPELWLQPDASPLHPRRMYCHTRLIYLGLGYVYGVRFQTPVTPIVAALRRELFDVPWESIDFRAHRFELAPEDTFEAPHPILRVVYRLCGAYDRVHPRGVRRRALAETLERIVEHQRESNHAAISPVNGLLNSIALHHAGHPDFAASFRGVDYWAWVDEEEGERFNGARSQTWDTAFAVQAVLEGPVADESGRFLAAAARYLRDSQMREEVPDRERWHRDQRRGGWCFSDEHHRWPVSDCTAEALSAVSHLAGAPGVARDLLPEAELVAEAARFILTRQNRDGGWGSYERQRGGMFLEWFNPSEMFGNCMVEHSYVECTASCLIALRHGLDRFAALFDPKERRRIEGALAAGAKLLRRTQEDEGGWPGFWGVNYTYGTLFGVSGLLAAGATRDDAAVRRACRWLVGRQLPGGGWGESYRGCVEERYIPHDESQVIMTSWALMTLLRADFDEPGARAAIDAGVRLLLERQRDDGSWPKEGVGGVFFNTAMHHYALYKDVFSVWALGLFAQRGA